MKKIKWGIIGLGNIANKFAQAVTKMPDCRLVAVASRTKEKSEDFGSRYGVNPEKCYGTYEEIVKDEEVDVIYIAVPHTMHKEISIMCLNNKKAVLCEKPVTLNEKETEEVIKCARENKTFFMEAMKTRFLPVHKKAKELIESGIIGEVRLIQADFGFFTQFDPNNRLFNPDLGGGALLDVGIYPVSYAAFLLGNKPAEIKSSCYVGKSGVDENVSAILTYEKGVEAHIYGAINLNTVREANIIGTKGRICVPRFSSGEKLILNIDGKEEIFDFSFRINGFEYQVEEVNNCLRAGKLQSEIMSWNDSVEIMKTLDIIKQKVTD